MKITRALIFISASFREPFGKITINIAPVYEAKNEENLVADVSSYMINCENMASEKMK